MHSLPARNSFAATFFLALSALVLTAPANAQAIDEIIVSVRKTEEKVQEVPIQITTLNQELIRSEAIRDLGDVAQLTPSLQFDQGFWPSDTRVSIRGLFARSGRPSAAVLVDGIDVNSEAFESSGGSALLNQRLLDLERIEIARGPQSALYGRAAFAGGINYVTRRPPEEFVVEGEGQVAEGGRFEVRASVGGPIIENVLTAKLIASHYELDGDYTNPNTGGKLGGGESDGIAFSLNWTPSENFSAYWNTSYTEDKFAPQAVALVTANTFRILQNIGENGILIPDSLPNPLNSPISAGCDITRVNPSSSIVGDSCLWAVTGKIKADESMIDIAPDPRTGSDFPGTDDKILRSYLIMDFDITDSLAFKSTTSYTWSEQSINFDSTQTNRLPGTPGQDPSFGLTAGNFADAKNDFEFKQIYQEFQLNGQAGDNVTWLAGLNAFIEDASDRNTSRFWYRNPAICAFVFPLAACSFDDAIPFDKTIDRDTDSFSIFGLVGWQFAEQWKLTLEGRWIRDKMTVTTDTTAFASDALSPPFFYNYAAFPGFRGSVSDTNFVPRVTLDFTPTDNLLLYASVAKGIKPPTFNTTDLASTEVNAVGTEELWAYELGAKSTLNDGRLLLNGALFYNDYQDQQTRVQFPPRPGAFVASSGSVNAGKVTVWGAEIDVNWLPTDNWTISAAYAYTNGEFDDFVLEEAQAQTGLALSRSEIVRAGNLQADFSGNDTPGNPEHAASLVARYQAPLRAELDWYAQSALTWQGERWADAANLVELESYWLANGQVGLQQQDRWTVALFVDNVFDDDTVRYAQQFIDQGQGFQLNTLTFPSGYFAYLPQPRTVGLRFSVRTP